MRSSHSTKASCRSFHLFVVVDPKMLTSTISFAFERNCLRSIVKAFKATYYFTGHLSSFGHYYSL